MAIVYFLIDNYKIEYVAVCFTPAGITDLYIYIYIYMCVYIYIYVYISIYACYTLIAISSICA